MGEGGGDESRFEQGKGWLVRSPKSYNLNGNGGNFSEILRALMGLII